MLIQPEQCCVHLGLNVYTEDATINLDIPADKGRVEEPPFTLIIAIEAIWGTFFVSLPLIAQLQRILVYRLFVCVLIGFVKPRRRIRSRSCSLFRKTEPRDVGNLPRVAALRTA